jgi:hypothetical protein
MHLPNLLCRITNYGMSQKPVGLPYNYDRITEDYMGSSYRVHHVDVSINNVDQLHKIGMSQTLVSNLHLA